MSTIDPGRGSIPVLLAESGSLSLQLPADVSIALSVSALVAHLYVQYTFWFLMARMHARAFARPTCRILVGISIASIVGLVGQVLSYQLPRENCAWGAGLYLAGDVGANLMNLLYAAEYLRIFYKFREYNRVWALVATGIAGAGVGVSTAVVGILDFSETQQRCWLKDGGFEPTFAVLYVATLLTSIVKLVVTVILVIKISTFRQSLLAQGRRAIGTRRQAAKRAKYNILVISVGYLFVPMIAGLLSLGVEASTRQSAQVTLVLLMALEIARGVQAITAALLYLTDTSMKLLLERMARDEFKHRTNTSSSGYTTPTLAFSNGPPTARLRPKATRFRKQSFSNSGTRSITHSAEPPSASTLQGGKDWPNPAEERMLFKRPGKPFRPKFLLPPRPPRLTLDRAGSHAVSPVQSPSVDGLDDSELNVGNGTRPLSEFTEAVLPWQANPAHERKPMDNAADDQT